MLQPFLTLLRKTPSGPEEHAGITFDVRTAPLRRPRFIPRPDHHGGGLLGKNGINVAAGEQAHQAEPASGRRGGRKPRGPRCSRRAGEHGKVPALTLVRIRGNGLAQRAPRVERKHLPRDGGVFQKSGRKPDGDHHDLPAQGADVRQIEARLREAHGQGEVSAHGRPGGVIGIRDAAGDIERGFAPVSC